MDDELNNSINRTAVFACGTEYHLLISFVLSVTVYRDSRKILLLDDNNRLSRYADSAVNLGLWDEVFTLDHKCEQVLDSVSYPAVLHFFSWGFVTLNKIFGSFVKRGVGDVILTDEGTLTYDPKVLYANWLKACPEHPSVADGFDIEVIHEIWVNYPDLYLGDNGVAVREVPLQDFVKLARSDENVIHRLKSLFMLCSDYVIPSGGVYFRQYIPSADPMIRGLSKIIDSDISALFQGKEVLIKKHPSDQNNLDFYSEKRLASAPWGLSLILNAVDSSSVFDQFSVFVSLTSSSIHNTALMLRSGVYIYLNRIIGNYSSDYDTKFIDLIADKIAGICPNVIVFQPESLAELSAFIEQFGGSAKSRLNLSALPAPAVELNRVSLLYAEGMKLQKKHMEVRISVLENELSRLKRLARIVAPVRIVIDVTKMAARRFWKRLPVNQSIKNRIKSFLFLRFPEFFRNSQVYKDWLIFGAKNATGCSAGEAYRRWIDFIEKHNLPSLDEVHLQVESMFLKPLISVILPVYNTNEVFLCNCIESVIAQSYPYWELCIADDASTAPHVRRMLLEASERDNRIKVNFRHKNGHISEASNSALAFAQGDYVALLDHDDTISEHALYYVVRAINETPGVQILYSDEDKINAIGERSDPHFKCEWNPDLFFSQNYISHLGVYRRRLLESIGGFRHGVEGSQDQDLFLRCLPHVRSDQIKHLPYVLYHWRSVEGSTAYSPEEKKFTTAAGIKALSDYFSINYKEEVVVTEGLAPNTYRVFWPMPEVEPLVTLLIPTRDKKEITEVAVRSILEKTTYRNFEIIILDNGSCEENTLAWFQEIQKKDGRVRVLRYNYPFNYSAINNFGVARSKGSIIGLINNDVEVISPDWLSEMVRHACRPEIGCVGAKLYYSDDTIQHGGIILGIFGLASHSHKHLPRNSPGYFNRMLVPQNLSAVTAACLLVRRDVYEAVGGLDEVNLKVAFNDVDFCLKVREAGYRNIWTPYAELYHHESISRGQEDTPEKMERAQQEIVFMQTKWGEALIQDPYYSPYLTRSREDFSLDCVPVK